MESFGRLARLVHSVTREHRVVQAPRLVRLLDEYSQTEGDCVVATFATYSLTSSGTYLL